MGLSRDDVPLIEARGLGVCFRLVQHATRSLKHRLLRGRLWGRSETFWALRDIDLLCREGQSLGVVGPNGAGKSTLCLALSGILQPDEGEVVVRGQVSSLLSLSTGFDNQLTGRQNVYLSGAFLGMSQQLIRSRVEEIVAFAELDAFVDQPVRTYSTGMRTRLAFAVATAVQPEILILDEILSVGDKDFRGKSSRRIRQLIGRSRLVVVVSHDAGILRGLCSDCIWLDQGRIRMSGAAGKVLDAYAGDLGELRPEEAAHGQHAGV